MHNLQIQYSLETLDEDEQPHQRQPLRATQPGMLPPAPGGTSSQIQKKKNSELILPSHFPTSFLVPTKSGEQINYYASSTSLSKCIALCIHGAGFSGLSFAQLAYLLRHDLTFVCVDLRGHGFSTHEGNVEFNQLVKDIEETFPGALLHLNGNTQLDYSQYKIIAIGHSLGGSLASAVFTDDPNIKIQSRILIDITEDTAVASLPGMEAILRRRPLQYSSMEEVVQNLIRTRTLTNARSVRIQLPGLVDEKFASRSNLSQTKQFWLRWFKGMNTRFIESSAWKLLLVSTLEKLDRAHEIAMMQGKIAVEVIPGCIHNLHEDQPVKVALVLQEYLRKLHLTNNTCDLVMDFRKGLTEDERPEQENTMALRLKEGWSE